MKVEECKESKFEPIVITLESQFEVDVLRELCGSIRGSGVARDFTSDLFLSLSRYSKDKIIVDEYFIGYVEVKVNE